MRARLPAVGFVVFFLACGASPPGSSDGPPDGGARDASNDAGVRDVGEPLLDAGTDPTPDAGETDASCGAAALAATFTPPDVLVLFDRSCSMRQKVDGTGVASDPMDPLSRYEVARRAVERQLTRRGERVHWGLALIPELREGCADPGSVRLTPRAGRADRIRAVFANPNVSPFGLCDDTAQPRQTPTLQVMQTVARDTSWRRPDHETFALLLTDGAAGCGATEENLASLTTELRASGVRTAVVGFGEEVLQPEAVGKLDVVAVAGGLARESTPRFYVADDDRTLDVALDEILRQSVSCRFALEAAPPDPSRLFVFGGGVPLDEEAWRYDPSGPAVELLGAACDAMRDGTLTRVDVVYGCPIPTCEPREETCNGFDEDCDDAIDEGCLL